MAEQDHTHLELSSGAGTPSCIELRTVAGETYVPPAMLQQLRRARADALAVARGTCDPASLGRTRPQS
jgi:hypothetical protein